MSLQVNIERWDADIHVYLHGKEMKWNLYFNLSLIPFSLSSHSCLHGMISIIYANLDLVSAAINSITEYKKIVYWVALLSYSVPIHIGNDVEVGCVWDPSVHYQNSLVDHGGQRQPAEDLLEQLEDLLAVELRGTQGNSTSMWSSSHSLGTQWQAAIPLPRGLGTSTVGWTASQTHMFLPPPWGEPQPLVVHLAEIVYSCLQMTLVSHLQTHWIKELEERLLNCFNTAFKASAVFKKNPTYALHNLA